MRGSDYQRWQTLTVTGHRKTCILMCKADISNDFRRTCTHIVGFQLELAYTFIAYTVVYTVNTLTQVNLLCKCCIFMFLFNKPIRT